MCDIDVVARSSRPSALKRWRYGHSGIPKVAAWGSSQYFDSEYLVMDRLGANLEDTMNKIGATRPTQLILVILVCQMLDIIEHVHEKGIVHCDIKPRNFVFGTGENAGKLHLIDFGLSRLWLDPTGKPLPEKSNCGLQRYAAIRQSKRPLALQIAPRRDDMESLAYTVVKLLTGTLPWGNAKSKEELSSIFYAYSAHTLCRSYDDRFARFVDDACSLQYEDTPRYQYSGWRSVFRELVPGLAADTPFDSDDASEPRVGTQKNLDRLGTETWPKPTDAEHADSDPLLASVLGGDSRSQDGGRHGFIPNLGSTWSCGEAVSVGDLFGDEFAVVAAGVELIDAPPETMKNEQSDTRCI